MTAHDSQLVCPNHLMVIPGSGEICFACEGGKFSNCTKNRCIHNSRMKSILASAEGYLYKWLKAYRYIDLLVCPSDFLKEKLSTNPLLAKKAVTIHNFIQAADRQENVWYLVYAVADAGRSPYAQSCDLALFGKPYALP